MRHRVAVALVWRPARAADHRHEVATAHPGKNFDNSGAFGPVFVTADALRKACIGLELTTRLNGKVVQNAMIDDMVFSVAQMVSICSSFVTLKPGDVIVTGTPAGVGAGRTPKLWMKHGDTCEVEIPGIGVLIEVKVAEKSSPTSKSDFKVPSSPRGPMGSMQRSQAPQVHPKRLAHVLIFTPDGLGSVRFYSRVLALRLSDQSGDGICFMHGLHGSDHHLIAFAND
ncbi:MAG: fumarylacetoacetate hydrolase family protein [Pseudomonadota bacterium]|nr:fumarylacetoacetate hydrolase family protein [Pseudomonadota bacterium]